MGIEMFGYEIGKLKKGLLNKISDVPGVTVGHCTINHLNNQTGVTVVMPSEDSVYSRPMVAACHVINGYGKTTGLMQLDEFGFIEAPLFLTNTLNVGLVLNSAVQYMIKKENTEELPLESINIVVAECNDSFLNDIQSCAVQEAHVLKAIENAKDHFQEGSVGAGRGMSCHQLKGGIGSASREIEIDGNRYVLGVLVQTNHGMLEDLSIDGHAVGKEILKQYTPEDLIEKGSMIGVIATNVPLDANKMKRLCKRGVVGMARTGSYIGNGSGEVIIGFSTANRFERTEALKCEYMMTVSESCMDLLYRGVAEAFEEAILNSMVTSERVKGYKGNERRSLKEFLVSP